MKTTKILSTISFNSFQFLAFKLDELVRNKIITFCAFIEHKGEDDEAGKKDHFHVYFEPNGRVDTDFLLDQFKEFDPTHPDLPLACLSFRPSKFIDWYLYVLHDHAYLMSKFFEDNKKYHYTPDEMLTSSDTELTFRIKSSEADPKYRVYKTIIDAIERGISFASFISLYSVPVQQIYAYKTLWTELSKQYFKKQEPAPERHPLPFTSVQNVTASEVMEVIKNAKNRKN